MTTSIKTSITSHLITRTTNTATFATSKPTRGTRIITTCTMNRNHKTTPPKFTPTTMKMHLNLAAPHNTTPQKPLTSIAYILDKKPIPTNQQILIQPQKHHHKAGISITTITIHPNHHGDNTNHSTQLSSHTRLPEDGKNTTTVQPKQIKTRHKTIQMQTLITKTQTAWLTLNRPKHQLSPNPQLAPSIPTNRQVTSTQCSRLTPNNKMTERNKLPQTATTSLTKQ